MYLHSFISFMRMNHDSASVESHQRPALIFGFWLLVFRQIVSPQPVDGFDPIKYKCQVFFTMTQRRITSSGIEPASQQPFDYYPDALPLSYRHGSTLVSG